MYLIELGPCDDKAPLLSRQWLIEQGRQQQEGRGAHVAFGKYRAGPVHCQWEPAGAELVLFSGFAIMLHDGSVAQR